MSPKSKAEVRVPTLSSKEALIIDLLLHVPSAEMYGLELVNNSGKRLKRGTVYVTLGRMQDKGYVDSRQEAPQPDARGIPRRLYRLTGYGQKIYDAWQLAREAAHMHAVRVGGAL
jgi:DNA-binding PadR family transcriptional regulator